MRQSISPFKKDFLGQFSKYKDNNSFLNSYYLSAATF